MGGRPRRQGRSRLPLIVGPSIAGAAFLYLAFIGLSDGPSHYWVTFFPGFVLLGIGMGITVAPLTTAVMSSVATHFAGTASGSTTPSREPPASSPSPSSALLPSLCSPCLQMRTGPIEISSEARAALSAEAPRLGAAAVPSQVVAEKVAEVQTAIRLAFVDAFRMVMLICTALAWIGAALAGFIVERKFTAAE